MTDKEELADKLAEELGFDFNQISKAHIIGLIEKEIVEHKNDESSEYIRLLCGYLFCLGDRSDIPLLKKAKYGINMDVGCMIDGEWIQSLENDGAVDEAHNLRSREELIKDFVRYYGGENNNVLIIE